jgi:hypothetical protein
VFDTHCQPVYGTILNGLLFSCTAIIMSMTMMMGKDNMTHTNKYTTHKAIKTTNETLTNNLTNHDNMFFIFPQIFS